MRALHLSTNPEFGGGERQVLALAAGSAARGVEVELVAHAHGKLLAAARAVAISNAPLRGALGVGPVAVARLARRLKRGNFGVLHAHDGGAASLGVPAAALARVPVLVHRRIASPLRRNAWTRWKYSGRRVARFVAVSETVRDALRESGVDESIIRVVPSGTDVRRMDSLSRAEGRRRLELPDAAVALGTIGKLAPKKGADVVLRAFADLYHQEPRAVLILIGDGPDRASLTSEAAALGVADRVRFLGEQPDGAALLAGLDIFLFGSELEGAPGVLREAMALRVPVVAVDAPGSREVLGDTGLTVARSDARAMAAAAESILRDPASSAARVSAARARVCERFSLDAMVEATLAVAREVADGR